jgi:DNA-binding response OmpR family regulator
MAETKRRLKVFLCHAHSDVKAVRDLNSVLDSEGVDAWLDKEKLLPGAEWELEIRKAVRESDVVIVCLSKNFNQAGFRQKEVRIALDAAMEKPEGEIFIIPARLEECESPENLSRWQWVDLFEEDGIQRLLWALRARAGSIGVTLRRRKVTLPAASSIRKRKPDQNIGLTPSKSQEPGKTFPSSAPKILEAKEGPATQTTAQRAQALEDTERLPYIWMDEDRTVWRDWEKLGSLRSTAQFNVLAYLIAHRGKLCTYSSLFEAVGDERLQGRVEPTGQERVVFLSVHGIRRLIEADPKNPKLLIEVSKRGYILVG